MKDRSRIGESIECNQKYCWYGFNNRVSFDVKHHVITIICLIIVRYVYVVSFVFSYEFISYFSTFVLKYPCPMSSN